MTGHDRTQPDTKPDISDICARDTVQNTPDTTGHYRTLPDTTGHKSRTCYRTCYRTSPDMFPDMTGHDRTSRTTGHPRLKRFSEGLEARRIVDPRQGKGVLNDVCVCLCAVCVPPPARPRSRCAHSHPMLSTIPCAPQVKNGTECEWEGCRVVCRYARVR